MFRIWLRVRHLVDSYFRRRRLQPGLIRISEDGIVSADDEDLTGSDAYKNAGRAAYWTLSAEHRPKVSEQDQVIMRRSLSNQAESIWQMHVHCSPEGPLVLLPAPGLCVHLGWQEGDRLALRRLFTGELILSVDRRARSKSG